MMLLGLRHESSSPAIKKPFCAKLGAVISVLSAMAARFNLLAIAALFFVFAAAVTPAESVTITFRIEKLLVFGQGFVIAGNNSVLGNFVPASAPLMSVTGSSSWSLSVNLTAGTAIAFKPVLVVYDTKALICWAAGSDNVFTVPTTTSSVFISSFQCDSQVISIT